MSKQLVVYVPASDGQWWHCGGPDLESAIDGLRNILANGNEDGTPMDIKLVVREMTDEEVAAIPDV